MHYFNTLSLITRYRTSILFSLIALSVIRTKAEGIELTTLKLHSSVLTGWRGFITDFNLTPNVRPNLSPESLVVQDTFSHISDAFAQDESVGYKSMEFVKFMPEEYRDKPETFADIPRSQQMRKLAFAIHKANKALDSATVTLVTKLINGQATEKDTNRLEDILEHNFYLSPAVLSHVEHEIATMPKSNDGQKNTTLSRLRQILTLTQASQGAAFDNNQFSNTSEDLPPITVNYGGRSTLRLKRPSLLDRSKLDQKGNPLQDAIDQSKTLPEFTSLEDPTQMKSQIFDLSLPLTKDVLRFPTDPQPEFVSESIAFGDNSLKMSKISMGMHIGTHVDAPGHFIPGGSDIGDFSPDTFLGSVYVVDLSREKVRSITPGIIREHNIPNNTKRLFIKTLNSSLITNPAYTKDHVYLSPGAVDLLIGLGIRVLGFDYYNVDSSSSEELPSHIKLAKANIPVIVALSMAPLSEGHYQMAAIPLNLPDLEASPIRVLMWK